MYMQSRTIHEIPIEYSIDQEQCNTMICSECQLGLSINYIRVGNMKKFQEFNDHAANIKFSIEIYPGVSLFEFDLKIAPTPELQSSRFAPFASFIYFL